MSTIKNIADAVGVSCTTVSNVIHGKYSKVSKQTIEKIQAVIKELDYVPNMSARSLVLNSSRVIGMINHIITRDHPNFLDDPFQSSFIGVIEQTLRIHGYYLMVRTIETPEALTAFLRNWNVDGLFFTGIYKDNFFDVISNLEQPVVLIDSYVESPNICNVGLNDFQGCYTSTQHLIQRGHRNIGFVSPPIIGKGVLYERLLGYQAALKDAGIAFNPNIVFEAEMDIDSCKTISAQIAGMRSLSGLITTADIMAGGLMACLKEKNIRIPEDLSIIGFDDINLCRMLTPTLTTIHQDINLKGKIAVDLMLQRLNGETPAESNITLPVSLIERESVRTLNA